MPDARFDGALVASAVLALCLGLLARYGVVFTPDSPGFVGAADALAAPGGLLDGAALRQQAAPVAFYRPPLYPLLILAARGIAGAHWPGLLVAAQLALAFAATLAFHRALLALTGSRALALLGALAQATSFALATHIAILADSFYASLLCLAFSRAAIAGLGDGLGPGAALWVGAALGAGTLLREVGAYTGLLWLPLIVAAAWPRGRQGVLSAVAAALVPMLGVVGLMLAWNYARTGQAFLTTVGQIVYFQALLPLVRQGLPVFAADPALQEAAAASLRSYDVAELHALSAALFSQTGLDAVAIARLAARTWRQAWIAHPAAMATAVLSRIKAHHFLTLFLPLENIATVPLWVEQQAPLLARFDRLGRAAMRFDDPGLVLLWLLALACRAIAAAMALAFLLVPFLALRQLRASPGARLALAAWPVLPGTVALHALVHLEIRYFAPAMPLAIGGAMWCAARLLACRCRA
jgi:hypothetical protein